MAFKIYVQDNTLYLIDTTDNKQYEGHAKNCLHRRVYTTSTSFAFTGLNYWKVETLIEFSNLQDKDGNPLSNTYADAQAFSDYLDTVLGKSSPQAGGVKHFGFFDYNDSLTATTPISVIGGGGFVYLTNNEKGAFTNKLYPPNGITKVWNPSINSFDFTELPLGSKLDYRLDIEITTTSPNQDIEVEIELAIGGSTYSLGVAERQYKTVKTHKLNVENYVYMGDLNTRDNPAKFKIQSDANATVKVNGWACYIFVYGD